MTRRTWLWVSGVSALALVVVLLIIDRPMAARGGGIVCFELAGDGAAALVGGWGASGQSAARWSLGLDFVFLVAYAVYLTLAVLGARLWPRVARVVVFFPAVAAVFDVVEDIALLLVLDGHTSLASTAKLFALLKFAALGLSLLYLVAAYAPVLLRRLRS